MASIEAQISAAFAADAPKTQFVRPTDADAWGGSTDKKTWTKPTDEKKPEGPQSLEDGRWGPEAVTLRGRGDRRGVALRADCDPSDETGEGAMISVGAHECSGDTNAYFREC